jgi:hypothetical protein
VIRGVTLVALPLVLVAAIVAVALHGDDEAGSAQGRIVVDGRAVVTGSDRSTRTVVDQTTVDYGDTVLVEDGTATLELAGGARYELRHHDGTGTQLEVGSPPTLLTGDALVLDGFPAALRVGGATLRARGPMKAAAEDLVAEAYAGGTGISGVAGATELAALRRLVLVPGAEPEPIMFDGTDPWDRRYLGEAIAFGEQLEAIARGYTRGLPPGGDRSEDFFRSVLPALASEREFGDDLLDPGRPPGETLVGAAIAVQGGRGTFRDRWAEVFSFRAAGAAWGLVALDQGVSSAPVLQMVELAIDAPSSPGRTGTPVPRSTPTTSPSPPAPTPPSTPPSVPPATTPSVPDAGSPPSAPSEPPPPESTPGLLDPVTEPVFDLLDGLLDGLLGTP